MKDVSAGCKTLVLRKIPSLKLKLVKCYGGVDIFVSFVDKNVTTNSAVLPPPPPHQYSEWHCTTAIHGCCKVNWQKSFQKCRALEKKLKSFFPFLSPECFPFSLAFSAHRNASCWQLKEWKDVYWMLIKSETIKIVPFSFSGWKNEKQTCDESTNLGCS